MRKHSEMYSISILTNIGLMLMCGMYKEGLTRQDANSLMLTFMAKSVTT